MSDEVLKQAVEGISELITTPGNVGNIDFADIRAVLENAGSALMGIGTGTGENRAVDAAKAAISSPLIDVSIHGAKGVLFSIAGSDDLTMFEISEAARVITESVDPDAKIIFGTVKDEKLKKNEVRITVVAANFPDKLTAVRNIFRDRETMVQESVSSQDDHNNIKKDSGKIFNSISINKKEESLDEDESSNIMKPVADTDEDDWSAVPAFLRRAKNR
jgi:cell division protein FtsZ